MNIKEILTSRHNVARATRILRAADTVLDSVFKARDGSRLSQGLAIAGAAGAVLDALIPEKAPHDQLLDMGYKPLHLGLGQFFCDMLAESGLPRGNLQLSAATTLVTWDAGGQGSVAAIYRNDQYEAGPYVAGGDRDRAVSALRSVAWSESVDLMLDTAGQNAEGRSYKLQALGEPGVYFGVPKLEWFVQRLERHHGETRSMLLVGPTGVGKSTLGRLIAREVNDGKGRLLKVGSRVIRGCSVTDLVEIAEFLQPDVLLLDDVSMIAQSPYRNQDDGSEGQMLELMEALHGKARLVIATLMLEPNQGGGGHIGHRRLRGGAVTGSDYFSGMRPGRVDEVTRVKRPSPHVREEILLHYLGGEGGLAEHGVTKKIFKDMVVRTEGLTGAYLKEVAHRIRVHGVKTYKGEIKSVCEAAPKLSPHARRNSRGIAYPRRSRRKTAAQRKIEELALKNEALEAKLEVVSLKLKEAKRKKK